MKIKWLNLFLLSFGIIGIIFTSLYTPSPSEDVVTPIGLENERHNNVFSMEKIKSESQTTLTGQTVEFKPYIKKLDELDNSKVYTNSTGSSTDIQPSVLVTWPDTKVHYNSLMRFATSTNEAWQINKGVTATFQFELSSNEHSEVGFMDKDGVKLQVLHDGKTAGIATLYTPTSDVEGYFYIENKAAAGVVKKNIRMSY